MASFSCSISPFRVLSANQAMTNTKPNWLRFGAFFDTPLFLRDPIEGSIETTRAPSLLAYDMVRSWNRCRGRSRGATGLARVEQAVVPVHEGGRVRRNLAIRPTSPRPRR